MVRNLVPVNQHHHSFQTEANVSGRFDNTTVLNNAPPLKPMLLKISRSYDRFVDISVHFTRSKIVIWVRSSISVPCSIFHKWKRCPTRSHTCETGKWTNIHLQDCNERHWSSAGWFEPSGIKPWKKKLQLHSWFRNSGRTNWTSRSRPLDKWLKDWPI